MSLFYSSILTMSVLVQCMAVYFLAVAKAYVSGRVLMLEGRATTVRWSCTVRLDGCLPVDASDDYVFQMMDGPPLMRTCWSLHRGLGVNRHTCQANSDNWNNGPIVLMSRLLAVLFHADMNERQLFDTIGMTGLNLASWR